MATEDGRSNPCFLSCSAYNSEPRGAPGTAAYSSLCWPANKRELKVFFKTKNKIPTWRLDDRLQTFIDPDKILEWANLWSNDKRSSVPKFVETDNERDSDIRVLLKGTGSSGGWSLLGTTAASHKSKATMILNFTRNDDDYRQFLVVHEFGHALGLGHPHQLSCLADALDEDATKKWLQRVCGLCPEKAEEMFRADFHAYSGVSVPDIGTFDDAASVMCYPIGAECFKDEERGGLTDAQFDVLTCESFANRKCPSKTDILTIHELYKPLAEPQDEHGVFHKHYTIIQTGIQLNLGDVVPRLTSHDLIDTTASYNVSPAAVMESLDSQIRTMPSHVYQLLEALEGTPELSEVARKLRQDLALLPQGQQHPVSSSDQPAAYVPGSHHPPIPLLHRLSGGVAAPVSPPEPPSLDELLESYGVEVAVRSKICSDGFLAEVAPMMSKLRSTDLNLEAVTEGAAQDSLALLSQWKARYACRATYENLVQCLWSAQRMDLVEVVCHALSPCQSDEGTLVSQSSISSDTTVQHPSDSHGVQSDVAAFRSLPVEPINFITPTPMHTKPLLGSPMNSDTLACTVEPQQATLSVATLAIPLRSCSTESSSSYYTACTHLSVSSPTLSDIDGSEEAWRDKKIEHLGQEVAQKDEEIQAAKQEIERLTQELAKFMDALGEKGKEEYFKTCLDITKKRLDRVEQEKRKLMDKHDDAIEENQRLRRELEEAHSRAYDRDIEIQDLKLRLRQTALSVKPVVAHDSTKCPEHAAHV